MGVQGGACADSRDAICRCDPQAAVGIIQEPDIQPVKEDPMPIYLAAESPLKVGQSTVIEAPAEEGTYVVVFEDDEDTGYFYALDTAVEGNAIQDALHIYNVADVSDKHKPSSVKIGWSADHSKAVLLINDYPHAIFDFTAKQGYCRSGFPPQSGEDWSRHGHEWDDAALELFA